MKISNSPNLLNGNCLQKAEKVVTLPRAKRIPQLQDKKTLLRIQRINRLIRRYREINRCSVIRINNASMPD